MQLTAAAVTPPAEHAARQPAGAADAVAADAGVRRTSGGAGSMASRPRAIVVLRWIAVIPAALIGAGLFHLVSILGNSFTLGFDVLESNVGMFLTRTISNILFGGAFVIIAFLVAPRHKSRTAIFVASLFLAGSVAIWLSGLGIDNGWDAYGLIISNASCLAASVLLQKKDHRG